MTVFDPTILEPVTLSDEDKEVYLKNLEKAFTKISLVLGSSGNIDASISGFASSISKTMSLFQYNDGNSDPTKNTGVYKEINIDRRSGFPALEDMVVFSSKAASASQDLHRLGSTREAAEKAADVILNWEPSDESIQELEKANETIRMINFLNRIQARDYVDLPEGVGSKIINIDLIGENDKVENFKLFYAAWDLAKHFFSSYTVLLDDDKEKYMKIVGPEKPGHVFKESQSGSWLVSEDVKKILGSSFGLHPQHYFIAFNELEGIHPQKMIYFGIERFESKHSSKHFTDLLKTHSNAGILTATIINIKGREEVGNGKTRKTKFDQDKDSSGKLYVICSDNVKAGVMEYYKHNKQIEFEIIPY